MCGRKTVVQAPRKQQNRGSRKGTYTQNRFLFLCCFTVASCGLEKNDSISNIKNERKDDTLSALRLGVLDRIIDVHAVGSERVRTPSKRVHTALVPLSIKDIPNGGCECFFVFLLIGSSRCCLRGDRHKLLIERIEHSCGRSSPVGESTIGVSKDRRKHALPILEGVEHGFDLPRFEVAADGVLDFELGVLLVQFAFEDVEVYRIDDEVLEFPH